MEQIKITHHNRQVDGSVYMPENRKRCPIAIMSHGYNGHQSDFAQTAQYLAAGDQRVREMTLRFVQEQMTSRRL